MQEVVVQQGIAGTSKQWLLCVCRAFAKSCFMVVCELQVNILVVRPHFILMIVHTRSLSGYIWLGKDLYKIYLVLH